MIFQKITYPAWNKILLTLDHISASPEVSVDEDEDKDDSEQEYEEESPQSQAQLW